MTDLSFLIHLLLDHKLAKTTRDVIAARIKEVESQMPLGQAIRTSQPYSQPQASMPAHALANPFVASQSPSTQAAMARHADPSIVPQITREIVAEQAPVAVVAQTPMAQAAMISRHQAIAVGIKGEPIKGETRPRKW
jgi:hypothetical protein